VLALLNDRAVLAENCVKSKQDRLPRVSAAPSDSEASVIGGGLSAGREGEEIEALGQDVTGNSSGASSGLHKLPTLVMLRTRSPRFTSFQSPLYIWQGHCLGAGVGHLKPRTTPCYCGRQGRPGLLITHASHRLSLLRLTRHSPLFESSCSGDLQQRWQPLNISL
jgi:hypothetical protein